MEAQPVGGGLLFASDNIVSGLTEDKVREYAEDARKWVILLNNWEVQKNPVTA